MFSIMIGEEESGQDIVAFVGPSTFEFSILQWHRREGVRATGVQSLHFKESLKKMAKGTMYL
jgi:hypothetical protein